MLGWVLAAGLMIFAAGVVYRRANSGEVHELTQMVTIRCAETGETWQVLRGVMEKELYMRPYPINTSEGLINPKTGKPTGFPIDDWTQTVQSVNAALEGASKGVPAPAAPPALKP